MDEQERWAYRLTPGAPSGGAAARAKVALDEQLGRVTEPWIVVLADEYNEAMQLTEHRDQVDIAGRKALSRYRRLLRRLGR